MKAEYVLVLDQSTSATKALLFTQTGEIKHRCNVYHKQYYPRPNWVEHDAAEIYNNTLSAISRLIKESGVKQEQVRALAITNQRETFVVWDKTTGEPVYNAIVWQCQRGSDICHRFGEMGYGPLITKKTGLILDTYFSASKVKWLFDTVIRSNKTINIDNLLFGTIDTWLVWKLTNGKTHITDYSNASRTMLFNIYKLEWDSEILDIFDIPAGILPRVDSSSKIFGYTKAGIFKKDIPIASIIGDSSASLFGQCCFKAGTAKATYGTGSSIMMNIGIKPKEPKKGIVTSIAWGIRENLDYVFEGNIHCTGDTIKWLVENIELIPDEHYSEELAVSIPDNGGVYLVPAFLGLGAPYWDNKAKASFSGMARSTRKAHLVRAALESIAYQIKDLVDVMVESSGINLKEIRVDGGPTKNNFLMQFQANMLDALVVRNKIEEVSALGALYMAGLATGLWKEREDLYEIQRESKTYSSKINDEERERYYYGWRSAVRKTLTLND